MAVGPSVTNAIRHCALHVAPSSQWPLATEALLALRICAAPVRCKDNLPRGTGGLLLLHDDSRKALSSASQPVTHDLISPLESARHRESRRGKQQILSPHAFIRGEPGSLMGRLFVVSGAASIPSYKMCGVRSQLVQSGDFISMAEGCSQGDVGEECCQKVTDNIAYWCEFSGSSYYPHNSIFEIDYLRHWQDLEFIFMCDPFSGQPPL